MTHVLRIVGLLFLICISNGILGQSKEIKIRFIGNCGLHLSDGDSDIYIDFPYKSGAHNYMEYDLSELDSVKFKPIFIYTHKHSDHYSKKLVTKLANNLEGKVYGPWNVKELLELNNGLQDFVIEPFKTKHRFSFNHYSYLITWNEKRIFISGDTEHAETIASVTNIDWAFVPAWLLVDAIRKDIKLTENIKHIAVYHIGPNDNITTQDSKIKLLTTQGEVITIGD